MKGLDYEKKRQEKPYHDHSNRFINCDSLYGSAGTYQSAKTQFKKQFF